jgi:hypothetical protein
MFASIESVAIAVDISLQLVVASLPRNQIIFPLSFATSHLSFGVGGRVFSMRNDKWK